MPRPRSKDLSRASQRRGFRPSFNESPHDADYSASGTCPSGPNAGARFAIDDGKTYDVNATDPYLQGCNTGGPDEPACQRSPIYVVHGKAGGGTKTAIVN